MTRLPAAALPLLVMVAACQHEPRPIFPPVDPPRVWPGPPDQARLRYVGSLRGEADLDIQPQGWEALRQTLAGPAPQAEFVRPVAVAVHGSVVFVADAGLAAVHRLDLDARTYAVLSGDPDDPLVLPIAVVIAGDRLITADRQRGTLEVFTLGGEWRRTLRFGELTAPVALAYDAQRERLWVADVNAQALFALERLDGPPRRMGERGKAPGQFNYPTSLAFDPAVGLVVADAMNFRVQVLTPEGTPVIVFGRKGDAAGDFALPRAVAVDSDGHIYVVDNQFENVQIFDAAGRLLLALGEEGGGIGQFALPSGITIDANDRVWVADSYNGRVQVFDYLAEEVP